MRRYLFLLLLALPAAGILVTGPPIQWAEAQKPKGEPEQPDDEPAPPEKLGKLTLTLDPGWHMGPIRKVFFTPDGKQVITLSGDRSIRIWDALTGEMRKVLYPPAGGLGPAALSADGKRLALAQTNPEGDKVRHVISIVTLPEGRIERVLRGHTETISALTFSLDGKLLASASGSSYQDNTIRLWNLDKEEAGQVLRKVVNNGPKALCFSPDGSRLAWVGRRIGEIIDRETGEKIAPLKGYQSTLDRYGVDWSADGKTLATIDHKGVQLWDADGKLRLLLPTTGSPTSVVFSKDSRTVLATTCNEDWGSIFKPNKATLYEVHTGKQLVGFPASQEKIKFTGAAFSGAISPDGQLAVTAGDNHTFVWSTENGARQKTFSIKKWLPGRTINYPDENSAALWSTDGKAVAWTKKGKAPSFHLGDLQVGAPLAMTDSHGPVVDQGAWSLKKDVNKVRVLKNGKPSAVFDFKKVRGATLLSQGRVALEADGSPFGLHDAHTGKLIRRFQNPGIYKDGLAASPDGRFLLTIAPNQTLRVWNPDQEKPLLSLYMSGNDWIIWTPEGYYAATPGGERLMGWTVDNGIDQMPTYYAAERFRKQLYRPDVIKLLLEKGNLKDALETANAVLRKEGKLVPEGIADPNKLLPPKAFLQILDKKDLPKIKVKARAVAAVPNQPVTVLRLLVDGRPLPDKAGYTEGKNEDVWDITLPPGKHHLAVLARSPDASSVSESLEVEVVVKAEQPVLHVLAIGINNYEDKTLKLDFAAKDAQDIAIAFKTSKGGLFSDVRSQSLVNANARRDTILKELADLRKKADPNDLVVVFFAGHGVKEKDKFYLLTVEAKTNDLAKTSISGEDLRKALSEIPCQVLLMLDACHSSGGIKNFRPAVDDITRNLTDDECGVAVLCAAMAHEKALEKSGNGLFTRAVVQALQGGKNVPHRNQRLYVHHLHGFVLDEVATLSNDQQHPFLSLPWVVESFPVAQFAANVKP